jgi:TonB-linked SusC/RagA family outer membrane protein
MTRFVSGSPLPDPRAGRALGSPLLRRMTGLAALLVATSASALAAQSGTVAGVVVAEGSSTPISEAQVRVASSTTGTTTDAAGRFRLTGLTGTDVSLEIRRLGYRPTTVSARVGTTDLRVELPEKRVELDAVVVTGTAGATERRAVGNAVSTIKASEVTDLAPVQNISGLLNGRAAGVVVLSASGNVGTGSRIRVRGTSSLSLTNQPLIYVDGVRVNREAASGPSNQAFGSSSISRMNDLNPDEIESIEIIKGPAAATLYGTEASNGVVQIITKKGAAGKAQWMLTAKHGGNYLEDPEGRFPVNYQTVNGAIEALDIVEREKSLGHPIWRTGKVGIYDLSVNGGSELFRFYVSGALENSEGIDPNNSVHRVNSRANVTLTPNSKTTVNVSTGYAAGRTRLPCEAGCGGRVWGTILANPQNLVGANARQRGFHSGTPEEYDLLTNFWQQLDRFTGSLQLNHAPISWFTHRLNAGTDRTGEDNVDFTPRVDSLVNTPAWGSGPLGGKSQNNRRINVNTVDYAATASFDLTPQLRSQSSAGAQFYQTETSFIGASGSIFPAPGLSAISALTIRNAPTQDFVEERSLGFFVQQQIGWNDRVFLTGGLRSDDHSAFGQNFDRVYYPKVSASWVVSEEPFWKLTPVTALKLRAAYGQSGQQPANFDALRTYSPVAGPGDVAAATPNTIGNPDLGPEKGEEIELGFDAGFLNDRLGLEFTYYNKKNKDAILLREIPGSLGFSGSQPFNAGSVKNTGLELLARARPWDRQPVSWDVTVNLSTNTNEILSLGPPPCADPLVPNVPQGCLSFVQVGAAYQRHQIGGPVGAIYEQKIVSAQFAPNGTSVTNVMCADGRGGTMPCTGPDAIYGNGNDAPDIYLGNPNPKVEGSVTNTVTLFNRLRLYGMVDFKSGYKKLDGNARVRCAFFGGRCRENFYPSEFAPEVIAEINSSNNLVGWLFDDAAFVKLRELAVSYSVPDRFIARRGVSRASITLAGRNLHTWTDYGRRGGLDPEAFFLSGTRGTGGQGQWEQTTVPQLAQWLLTVTLGF